MGTNAILFFGIFLFAYVFFFLRSKNYLVREAFSGTIPLKVGDEIPVQQSRRDGFDRPYSTQPIMKVDDYDQDFVYSSEGDRQLSKAQINEMTAAYPFDFAKLPPSASKFQREQAEWMAEESKRTPADLRKYETIEGFASMPPDKEKLEIEEQKLLKTYVPACSKDLKYDVDDAMDLIKRIYDKKGLEPIVNVREDGVYEVYETKEKNPKIVYEDDGPKGSSGPSVASADMSAASFQVPQTVRDLSAGLDPFFNTQPRLRSERTDYTQWTPGLERMFAPTYDTQKWY
jgi:hypothetical protein